MTVNTAAGSKLFIGPVVDSDTDTQGEFEGLAYTEIGEIENFGELGDEAQSVTFTSVGDRRVRKFKGSFDAGTMSLTIGFDGADAGQTALRSALASQKDYAIKLELNDGSDGSPSSPTTFYFRGKVMSRRIQVGDANNVVRATVAIGVNSEIVEVAAV